MTGLGDQEAVQSKDKEEEEMTVQFWMWVAWTEKEACWSLKDSDSQLPRAEVPNMGLRVEELGIPAMPFASCITLSQF